VPQRHRRAIRRHVYVVALAAALFGGCGSTADAPDPVVVAALGDSITSGSPGYDPDPAQRAALGFGDDERSQYEYWAERAAEPKGGQTPFSFRNCGVFGERTDEIARRLDPCVDGAEVLIVQGGINDIAQGRPVAAAAADLESMVARGLELDLDVYLAEVLPWNNGHPHADRPIAELNRRIAAIGREQGVPVIGFHDELEDPAAPGRMSAQLTADGDHPSVAGYRLLGELLASKLATGAPG
jgi:lysophospholipase L1-like esterase